MMKKLIHTYVSHNANNTTSIVIHINIQREFYAAAQFVNFYLYTYVTVHIHNPINVAATLCTEMTDWPGSAIFKRFAVGFVFIM